MSTLAIMKLLETSANRYDWGIQLITLGGARRLLNQTLEIIKQDDRVLDIGCGTGTVSLAAARKGAHVTGIDINPFLLRKAKQKAQEEIHLFSVQFLQMSALELEQFPPGSFDIVICSLLFSELSPEEQMWVLRQVERILPPDGQFILIDELKASGYFGRLLQNLIRIPLALLVFLLIHSVSLPVANIFDKIRQVGLRIIVHRVDSLSRLHFLVCRKQK